MQEVTCKMYIVQVYVRSDLQRVLTNIVNDFAINRSDQFTPVKGSVRDDTKATVIVLTDDLKILVVRVKRVVVIGVWIHSLIPNVGWQSAHT